jgi:uncharacterized protein YbaP (TraB family)
MRISSLIKEQKFRLLLLLLFLALILPLTNAPYLLSNSQAETKRNFLWSIKNDKNTIYFLGSVHFLNSESYPLAVEIENAYKDSKKVVFETDIAGFNDPTFQINLVNLVVIPEGKTLHQYISEQTYKSLKEKAENLGLPVELFDVLRPWLCGLTVTAVAVQRLGLDPNHGIDVHFFYRSKEDGKQLVFLESVEDQLKLFTEMSKEQEEAFLGQTIKDLDLIEAKLPELVNAWTNGDADGLASIVEKSFKEHPEAYETMVVQRNKNWAVKIDDLIKRDVDTLVIVGAAHLVGHENLLELLRGRGYKIEQM